MNFVPLTENAFCGPLRGVTLISLLMSYAFIQIMKQTLLALANVLSEWVRRRPPRVLRWSEQAWVFDHDPEKKRSLRSVVQSQRGCTCNPPPS